MCQMSNCKDQKKGQSWAWRQREWGRVHSWRASLCYHYHHWGQLHSLKASLSYHYHHLVKKGQRINEVELRGREIEVGYIPGELLFGVIVIICMLNLSNVKWLRSENGSHPCNNDEMGTKELINEVELGDTEMEIEVGYIPGELFFGVIIIIEVGYIPGEVFREALSLVWVSSFVDCVKCQITKIRKRVKS